MMYTRWLFPVLSVSHVAVDVATLETTTAEASNASLVQCPAGYYRDASKISGPVFVMNGQYSSNVSFPCLYNTEGSSADLPLSGTPYTIEAWVKPTSQVGNGAIVGWGTYGQDNMVNVLRFQGPGQLVNYWWHNDLTTPDDLPSLDDGAFHHVAATWDGAIRRIIVDFEVVAEDEAAGYAAVDKSTFCVGRAYSSENFAGTTKNVKIWRLARTVDELRPAPAQADETIYTQPDDTSMREETIALDDTSIREETIAPDDTLEGVAAAIEAESTNTNLQAEVPRGCALYNYTATRHSVIRWSTAMRSRFATAEEAWSAVAVPNSDLNASGVGWHSWPYVWHAPIRRVPASEDSYDATMVAGPGLNLSGDMSAEMEELADNGSAAAAFHFLDVDSDETISQAEFTNGYWLSSSGSSRGDSVDDSWRWPTGFNMGSLWPWSEGVGRSLWDRLPDGQSKDWLNRVLLRAEASGVDPHHLLLPLAACQAVLLLVCCCGTRYCSRKPQKSVQRPAQKTRGVSLELEADGQQVFTAERTAASVRSKAIDVEDGPQIWLPPPPFWLPLQSWLPQLPELPMELTNPGAWRYQPLSTVCEDEPRSADAARQLFAPRPVPRVLDPYQLGQAPWLPQQESSVHSDGAWSRQAYSTSSIHSQSMSLVPNGVQSTPVTDGRIPPRPQEWAPDPSAQHAVFQATPVVGSLVEACKDCAYDDCFKVGDEGSITQDDGSNLHVKWSRTGERFLVRKDGWRSWFSLKEAGSTRRGGIDYWDPVAESIVNHNVAGALPQDTRRSRPVNGTPDAETAVRVPAAALAAARQTQRDEPEFL